MRCFGVVCMMCAGLATVDCGDRCSGSSPLDTPTEWVRWSDGDSSSSIGPVVCLDLLMVLDCSVEMTQELHNLADGFEIFIESLQGKTELDLRLGMLCMEGSHLFLPGITPQPLSPQVVPGQPCSDDHTCCLLNCFRVACGEDEECIESLCSVESSDACPFTCTPGDGDGDNGQCEVTLDELPCSQVTDLVTLFRCGIYSALSVHGHGISPSWPQGLEAARNALASLGDGFLRDEAFLALVFVTNQDDCSIHDEFCAPDGIVCEDDLDCPLCSQCLIDLELSEMKGKPTKVCCGIVKPNHNEMCALLGDYHGSSHHYCAYDPQCEECAEDTDCVDEWICGPNNKCRPFYLAPTMSASNYTSPTGLYLHSLVPVADYFESFRALKQQPELVLLGVIVGDTMTGAGPSQTTITEQCLGDAALTACSEFAERSSSADECVEEPSADGCESMADTLTACEQSCYLARAGQLFGPQSEDPAICHSNAGTASWGSRYLDLAAMFGENGLMENVCNPQGYSSFFSGLLDAANHNQGCR